jgi:hypothetical protein
MSAKSIPAISRVERGDGAGVGAGLGVAVGVVVGSDDAVVTTAGEDDGT